MNVSSPKSLALSLAANAGNALIQIAAAQMRDKQFTSVIKTLTPLLKSMDLKAVDPDHIFALLMMADAQRFSGSAVAAYKNYVVASELDNDRAPSLLKPILNCFHDIKTPIDSPIFEQHLIAYLHSPEHDNSAVDRLTANMLKHKFELENDAAKLDFATIIADRLLLAAMSHLVLADAHVERFLSQLRSQVFHLAIESNLPEELQPVVIALAEHAEHIEYAFPVSTEERILLQNIEATVLSQETSADELKSQLGEICLYAMFEPLSSFSVTRKIAGTELERWPLQVQPLFKRLIFDRIEEQRLINNIEPITRVTNDVSIDVMHQYEENPYPRWQHVFVPNRKVGYLESYAYLEQSAANRKRFNKQLNCLIAGCGTGKQPLSLASYCKDISIKAMDLSLPSLGYAKRKAEELGLSESVEFVQGDILELDALEEKFDVIECSGVLHHMQNPEQGLQALLRRLRKNGMLRLGLYSRIARDRVGINEARRQGTDASLINIRDLRAQYLQGNRPLTSLSRDFFSTSECRDLLFHVQEHQFDLIEIKDLIERNGLEFLGFDHPSPEVIPAFKGVYGDDLLSLDNWHQFEQNNPYIFKAMYQFHCQKKT
ncbi:MAG: 2-polyprenyl-3-methyl-5-hydroxy-6-metoxy-1,4-benzoquinol methylase [Candidatus Azotimanducaceae bacterium]|jgi:2-polyprenyl-3-methyl-5-hydroxy-6-metoxy-1,4-benzoquinol methylase